MSNEMIKPSVTLAIDLGATNLRVGLVKIDEKGMPFVVDVIRDSSAKDNPTVLYHEITPTALRFRLLYKEKEKRC